MYFRLQLVTVFLRKRYRRRYFLIPISKYSIGYSYMHMIPNPRIFIQDIDRLRHYEQHATFFAFAGNDLAEPDFHIAPRGSLQLRALRLLLQPSQCTLLQIMSPGLAEFFSTCAQPYRNHRVSLWQFPHRKIEKVAEHHQGGDVEENIGLIMESAYLIWVPRCERVIRKDDTPYNEDEAIRRWNRMMQTKADLDRKLSNWKPGRKALQIAEVRKTWEGTGLEGGTLNLTRGIAGF